MTDEDRAYDQRQYKLMLESIQNYRVDHGISRAVVDLGTLIRRLDALHDVLLKPLKKWSQSFQETVNTLAEVNGVLLDQEKAELDELAYNIVLEAIDQLTALVESVSDHSPS
jgi:hypothetical protein